MSDDSAEIYTLELRALPGYSVPGIQRIRRALKYLLRSCGLQCVTIDAEPRLDDRSKDPQSTPDATNGASVTLGRLQLRSPHNANERLSDKRPVQGDGLLRPERFRYFVSKPLRRSRHCES